MAEKGTVFQKGGGGTNFEQYLQSAFIVTMAVRGNVPGLPTGEIEEVVLQATNRGWETDDLYMKTRSFQGTHQVLAQAKHTLVFSEENTLFKEVMAAFWKDFHNPSFRKSSDRLLIIKNRLNNIEKNHIKGLLNYAKSHNSGNDFISEVDRIKEKKERLQIFRTVLTAIAGSPPNDTVLWEFLKCVDVLGYDFLNDGSVDEAYLLNLIKLAKSPAATASESQIWNSVLALVSKYNPSGGSLTRETIREMEFYSFFDPGRVEPVFRGVEKLLQDSATVIRPIKTTIGTGTASLHLPRHDVLEGLVTATNENDFVIVTGPAGSGKSAVVKDAIQKHFQDAGVFVFRAEQFNQPHLAGVLSGMEVPYAVEEVFSCLSLASRKIVFVDSLEKLLEDTDPQNAFSQFVSLAGENGIQIVATCRRYAVDLLIQKFGLDGGGSKVLEVPLLTEDELAGVSDHFPQVRQALSNARIRTLLKRPKYLDFAIRALASGTENFALSSARQFKNLLWDALVCKAEFRSGGLPAKREKAFMEIALTRARQMKLFARPQDGDEEAIDLLQNDEIILQDGGYRRYAPAHDLLEDWALEKYISDQFEEHHLVTEFFTSLGNEPAIRRGFRLWVEEGLTEDAVKTKGLIRTVLESSSVERYWADELLVALFQSERSQEFFTLFETDLLSDDAQQLERCLELIKTTCKQRNYEVAEKPVLLPIGSGWKEALLFIAKHIEALTPIRPTILSILSEWEYRLVYQYPTGSKELEAVRDIVLYYIGEVEREDEYWMQYSMKQKQNELLSILYTVATLAKESITALVQRALDEKDEKWQVRSFYELAIEKLLGAVRTQRLTLVLPDLLIQTAWKEWKYVKPEPREEERDTIVAFLSDSLSEERCWGIDGRFRAFPSGIYKTFVYHLLCFHPAKGLRFITEFINYSVAFYASVKCPYKHEVGQVQLTLVDGRVIQQYAGYELWVAYRGISVTDYLLESLLMSLETFLMEVAECRTEHSKGSLKQYYNYLLENSNSVMITGVLASVAMAHPTEVEEAMLPLVSLKEMYSWESRRPIAEQTTLAMMDQQIPYAQKKRWEWNQLPHRRKYARGFADFLVDYQITIKTLNVQLHARLDAMWAEADPEDVVWRKKLTEIDARKWVIEQVLDEEAATFVVQPGYENDIKAFIETGKEKMELANRAAGYSQTISKVYEEKEAMVLSRWNECYAYYSTLEEMDTMHDRPATFAAIGLRDFGEKLSEEQVRWCVRTLASTIGSIVGHTNSLYLGGAVQFNFLEQEVALESFHLLFRVVEEEDDKKELRFLLLYTIVARFAEHEIERLARYLRQTFAAEWPEEAKRQWQCLLHFSRYKKEHPYFYDDPDGERLEKARDSEFVYLENLARGDSISAIEIKTVSLKNASAHLLFITLSIIPPGQSDIEYREYLFRYIGLLVEDICAEEEDDFFSKQRRQTGYRTTHEVEKYLAEVFLLAEEGTVKELVTYLTAEAYRATEVGGRRGSDLIRFVCQTLDMLIYRIDELTTKEPEGTLPSIERFWTLWHHLFSIVEASGKKNFIDTLLLDTGYSWDDERDHPPFLEGRKEDYKKAVYRFGGEHLPSILKVISTVGRKAFLPEGLSWVYDLLQANPERTEDLNSLSGERLIRALYIGHMPTIKKDQKLVRELLYLLDAMVEAGNSTAFLFREDVITYRSLDS